MSKTTVLAAVIMSTIFVIPIATADAPFIAPRFDHPVQDDANWNLVADRLEVELARREAEGIDDEPIDVIVVFKRAVGPNDVSAFESLGGSLRHVYNHALHGLAGSLPANRIGTIVETFGPGILAYVSDDPTSSVDLEDAIQQVRARPHLWDLGYEGSSGSTIAILDTGIDDSHTDLSSRIVAWHDATSNPNPSAEDLNGHGSHVASIAAGTGARYPASSSSLSVTTTKSGLLPTNDHYGWYDSVEVKNTGIGSLSISLEWAGGGSTTVGGRSPSWNWLTSNVSSSSPNTINYAISTTGVYRPYIGNYEGANGAAYAADVSFRSNGVGDGYRPFRGMSPGADLAGVKVMGDDGHGSASDIIAGIDWCVLNRDVHNLRVINMSFSGSVQHAEDAAVTNAVANGIVVVCSAGNDFGDDTIGSPANAATSIAVGAVNDDGAMTNYSSNGFPGQSKPDVTAPGGSLVAGTLVTAVDSNDGDAGGSLPDSTANNYANLKGTSMSAPVVSGLAALLIDVEEINGDPWTATEAEALGIKKTILMTATESNRIGEENWNGGNEPTADSGNDPSLDRGPSDLVEGYGLVNADAAMEALTREFDTAGPVQVSFGSHPTDRRAAAWYIDLTSGFEPSFTLVVPTGADFDLYLYEPDPDANGRPVIAASSTTTGDGNEQITGYHAAVTDRYAVVVKRVSGSGTATLTGSAGTPLIFADGFEDNSTGQWSSTTP